VSVATTLPQCYAEVFATVFAFRAAAPAERPSYRSIRSRLMSLLAEGKRRAEEAHADPRGYAHYAVVALVDETMMSSDWEHVDEWRKEPLQVHYFGDFLAGEQFFDRLDEALRGEDPGLLETYFTCLCGGLRGMFRDDPDALAARRRKVYQAIRKVDLRDEQHLTEAAYGRNLERSLIRSHFPVWWLLPFVGGAIALYVAFYVILSGQVGYLVRLAG